MFAAELHYYKFGRRTRKRKRGGGRGGEYIKKEKRELALDKEVSSVMLVIRALVAPISNYLY